MVIKKYCFAQECLCGIMTIDTETMEKKMEYFDDSKLTEYARNYKKYIPLKTSEDIDAFISERAIDKRRPDRPIWLGILDIDNNASDLEIFLSDHGVSCNDLFWIDDIDTPDWWYEVYGPLFKKH